jgi:hypothetical protein
LIKIAVFCAWPNDSPFRTYHHWASTIQTPSVEKHG